MHVAQCDILGAAAANAYDMVVVSLPRQELIVRVAVAKIDPHNDPGIRKRFHGSVDRRLIERAPEAGKNISDRKRSLGARKKTQKRDTPGSRPMSAPTEQECDRIVRKDLLHGHMIIQTRIFCKSLGTR